MKKIIAIGFLILSIIASAFILFDSSDKPSINNEGLRKPDMAVSEPSGTNYNQTQ